MPLKNNFPFILTILFSFLLNLYLLKDIPSGFHVDEARAGYNAFSIFKTARDENGNFLPLFYNSFQEFRPTVYFYSIIPFIPFSGLSVLTVRMPAAVYGVLSVWMFYLILRKLGQSKRLSMLAAFILSVMPWFVILARASSEALSSLFWLESGIFLAVFFIKKNDLKFAAGSFVAFILAMQSYPPARMVIPMLLPFLLFLPGKKPVFNKIIISMAVLLTVISLPVLSAITGNNSRLNQVVFIRDPALANLSEKLIFGEGQGRILLARIFHNKAVIYSRDLIRRYSTYLGPEFALGQEIKPARYGFLSGQPVYYLVYFAFLPGLIYFGRKNPFLMFWFLLAIFPAAITLEDTPNVQRALLAAPPVAFFAAEMILKILKKLPRFANYIFLLIFTLEFGLFVHLYFIHGVSYAPYNRNEQSLPLAGKLLNIQKDYDKIVITNTPDNLYIYLLFAKPYDPNAAQSYLNNRRTDIWGFENFIFTGDACPSVQDMQLEGKVLYVNSGDCPFSAPPGEIIYYSNSTKAYRLTDHKDFLPQ